MADHDTGSTGQLQPFDPAMVWRLLAPWLFYIVVAAAGIVGLFGASRAAVPSGRDVGILCFALAVALVAWRINRQTGGRDDGPWPRLTVTSSDALLLYIAVLTALALGVLLLTTGSDATPRTAGLAFFVCCLALIFLNLKVYFDQLEARGQADPATSLDRQLEQKQEAVHRQDGRDGGEKPA